MYIRGNILYGTTYVDNGTIKIIFVRSEENDADIFTKYTAESKYNKHSQKFIN